MAKVYVSMNGVREIKDISPGLEAAIAANVDGIHLDLIHGNTGSQPTNTPIFTPNYIRKIVEYVSATRGEGCEVEMHLFADEPSLHIEKYVRVGISRLTLPYQAFGSSPDGLARVLPALRKDLKSKELALKIGVSLTLSELREAFEMEKFNVADYLLVLGAPPGYDSRPAFPGLEEAVRTACSKRASVKEEYRYSWFEFEIGVEGGMTLANMAAMKRAGADRVIFGRSFFDTDARQRPEFIKSARRP